MNVQEFLQVLAGLVTFVSSIFAAILSLRNGWKIEKTAKAIDGRLTQLVISEKATSTAEATLAERDRLGNPSPPLP